MGNPALFGELALHKKPLELHVRAIAHAAFK
jgi:hypothetical protein